VSDFEDRRDVSADERKRLAKKGWAMPDGSFPIANCKDLSNAIQALGRTDEAKRERVRAHIRKMAKVHGCELPESWQDRSRPVAGEVETRALGELSVDAKRLRGRIPYGEESRDLGGWREVIEPGALGRTALDGLVATVDHGGVPIGRYPGTLQIEDRVDGLHWSVEPPASRADVREAVERGDLRAGSWRMRVARDEWRGEVRHVHEIAELRDVAVVTHAAYPDHAASVELRHDAERSAEGESEMTEHKRSADRAEHHDEQPPEEERSESRERSAEPEQRTGNLQVHERRDGSASRSLAEEFRARGFDGETPATIPFREFEARAVSLAAGTTTEQLQPVGTPSVPLGADQRYAWPVFPSSPVDEGVTSVEVLRQKTRTLPAAADVIRAIDATSDKPEVGSQLELVSEPLKQVAAKESGIPNVYLAQTAIQPIIDTDLRLAVNEGLDKLVLDEIAAAGFQAPGTDPLLVSIRKAITTIQNAGYLADTLILRPADSELLDTLRVTPGATPTEEEYVFNPGQFAPNPWNLSRRVSKSAASPVVLDSQAFGRLHPSPVSLRTFEENDGATNTSLVRMELHALFAVQRASAAVRIAAS
jgi:phage head maturation protease